MTVADLPRAPVRRTLVLTMDQQAAVELARIGGGLLGGGFLVELYRRWRDRRAKQEQQPIELTAKLIDDGDELRRLLLQRVTHLEEQHALAIERAHRAEVELAGARPEVDKLRRRLERKDECVKALTAQLLGAGITPVLASEPYSGEHDLRGGNR